MMKLAIASVVAFAASSASAFAPVARTKASTSLNSVSLAPSKKIHRIV